MNNPFPYSNDNLRYHSFSYYLKQTYHQKVVKVPLDAGFSCPNRDGTCAYGGCTFCSSEGSGELVENKQDDVMVQYYTNKAIMQHKWPDSKTIPYFQAYSNTYAPLTTLKKLYEPFLDLPEVVAIAIATRPDCVNQDIVTYLQSLTCKKDIYLELGLQTIHQKTANDFNRGYPLETFEQALALLKDTNIKVCVHIINGLPQETETMMLETAQYLAQQPIHFLKIHMLHLLRDSLLGQVYLKHPWPLLSKDDYVNIVVKQLELLPPTLVLQRLTGDGMADKLIAPIWTQKKTIVLNDIQKCFVKRQSYQGIYYQK